MKIYLAGKIHPNDWRGSIVHHARSTVGLECFDNLDFSPGMRENVVYLNSCWTGQEREILPYLRRWPIIPKAIFQSHDYVGPYFIGCDHGCFHGSNRHGSLCSWPGGHGGHEEPIGPDDMHPTIRRLCLQALHDTDIVFAWIDDASAYGTIAEIGYARALQKLVFIASPHYLPDLWLTYEIADSSKERCHKDNGPICSHVTLQASSPSEALKLFLDQHGWDNLSSLCESPIELQFWRQARLEIPGLKPQVVCGPYRLDFALSALRLAVEIDGHDGHKSKEQRTHDAQRDRYLDRQGWTVLRFTGSEVFANVRQCIRELQEAMSARSAVMLNGGARNVIH